MTTLDTVTDFVSYLTKKEKLLTSTEVTVVATGEEHLLAEYLKKMNKNDEHDFILTPNTRLYFLTEGIWEEFTSNPQRLAQIHANKVSYAWDALIETFNHHALRRTQYYPAEIRDSEKVLRFMAAESRTRRRYLADHLMSQIRTLPRDKRGTRVIPPFREGEPYYIFLLLPHHDWMTYEDYRTARRNFLEISCRVLRSMYPDALDIIGIATESGRKDSGSEDAMYFDGRNWTQELQEEAERLRTELGLWQDVTHHSAHLSEYPEVEGIYDIKPSSVRVFSQKGRDRNARCPCGSGKKYKKCCWR